MTIDQKLEPDFSRRSGKIMVIVQDDDSGAIIDNYWIGQSAWQETLSGKLKIPSQRLVGIKLDCDKDCVLLRVIYGGKSPYVKIDALDDASVSARWLDGLITIITKDENGIVLMQAYANPQAVQETIKTGRATYWSTSRNELWKKGLTSGDYQDVKKIEIAPDLKTLIYTAEQLGKGACHEGYYSCFYRNVDFKPA